MKRGISHRCGFGGHNGLLVPIALLFVAIALAIPMLKRLMSAGWSWWSAPLIVLASFAAAAVCLLGIFWGVYMIARNIARLAKRPWESSDTDTWCILAASATMILSALPVFFVVAGIVVKWLAP
jgi:hypothetical protein